MKNTGNIALVLCIGMFAFIIGDKFINTPGKKVGVVQMEKLVYDFKGMKEASQNYSSKMKSWGDKSDSLENRLKDLFEQIKLDSINKDKEKLNRDIKTFLLFKQSLIEYRQNIQTNAEKEDKQMTIGVMNQINECIKTFAKNQGYDVILCNSQNQSVGYAKEQIDVTKDVLEFANAQYQGLPN